MNACNCCGALVHDEAEFDTRQGYCADCDADRPPAAAMNETPGEDLPNVTDCTGVSTGNSDIEGSSEWSPPQGEPDRAPLPGHEHLQPRGVWEWIKGKARAVFITQADYEHHQLLDLHAALDDLLHQARAIVIECPPAFAGVERRS